jgi:hypothetical protein
MRLVARARRQAQPRYGRNRRQRLAAKTQRRNRLQIRGCGNLGRRVPCDGKDEIFALDSSAVVGNANELDSAASKFDIDRPRLRIEAVLEQLLQRRRGALDHLAGGDLVDQRISEQPYRGHQRTSPFAQRA